MSATMAMPKTIKPALDQTPARCGEIFMPDYGALTELGRSWAKNSHLKSASLDTTKVALVMIDVQVDFCIGIDPFSRLKSELSTPAVQKALNVTADEAKTLALRFGQDNVPRGSLYVRGAEEDTSRLCQFIQANADVITTLVATLDTHKTYQIFHESFLVAGKSFTDPNSGVAYNEGDHPKPFTSISLSQVKDGTWHVNPAVAFAIMGSGAKYAALEQHLEHYCHELSSGGKYELFIWPYHVMLGTPGHALVPALAEVCHLFDVARGTQTKHEIKGGNPLTENYSPFCPEVLTTVHDHPIAQRNTQILDLLLSHDAVLFAGQAKSHCFKWAVDDLLSYIAKQDPSLAKKVYLLEDCTSPVVIAPGVPGLDFTTQANEAFDRFVAAGMNVIQSTESIRELLNIS